MSSLWGCLAAGPAVATAAPARRLSPAPCCTPRPACSRSSSLPSRRVCQQEGCRRAARLAAGGGGGASEEESSVEAAFAAVQSCMLVFTTRQSSGDLDNVVEFLPEAVIDRLLERKRAKR